MCAETTGMADAKYRTPEYRAAYKKLKRDQAVGTWLWCVQGLDGSSGTCLFLTRDISPDQAAHVAHDDSGDRIIGVSHATCNVTDGGRRRHLVSAGVAAPAAPNRWTL